VRRLSRLFHRAGMAVLVAALATAQAHVQAAEAAAEPADLRDGLSPAQQVWWDLEAQVKAILAGRRWGKSNVIAPWLVDGAIGAPTNSLCPYISLTRKSAEEILWIPLQEAAKRSGVVHKVNHAKLSITFVGGGRVLLAGVDKRPEIEKLRGKAIIRAAVDECGSMRPLELQYLHRDVLHPACLDFGGELAFVGTPGLVCEGYWWEMTRDDSEMGVPCVRGDARDNPFVNAAAYFQQTLETFHWDESHPTFVREYLGRWVRDIGDLVFPVDDEKNFAIALPTENSKGHQLAPLSWRYVLGVDVGVVDAVAISVVAAHPDLPRREFVVSSEKHEKWLIEQLARRLRELKQTYGSAPIVIDTGGMGKAHSEELRRKWQLAHEAAEKTDKASQVRLVRDGLLAGTLVLIAGEANDALVQEWAVMGWDAKRELPHPSAEDHASDGTLYALRRLRHYTTNEPVPPVAPGSPEAAEAEAQRAKAKVIAERLRERKGERRWR
jgi:hypothetical protein